MPTLSKVIDPMPTPTTKSYSHTVALDGRNDLKLYKNLARMLFALETRFRISDIHTTAADAVTDGGDDKKCDMVYIDRDTGEVVIAQSYHSQKERKEVSANKACDLNTAVTWLLSAPLAKIPKQIRSSASELRSALSDNEVRSFQIWFVHNMDESKNVDKELAQVEHTATALLEQHFEHSELEEIVAVQVGRETLEEWYTALETPILVSDEFQIDVDDAYEIEDNEWSSAVTSVPASWLYDAYKKFGSKLFSANVRDYLGSRRSTKNVNHNIKGTVDKTPGKFWVYNNGITALVHEFEVGDGQISIHGLSIVNGAQTTGAIGSLTKRPSSEARVQARFVKCTDIQTVKEIIQYNNTQNAVKVTDFRSNDPIQRRLRQEFDAIPNASYVGGRRGGEEDKIRRSPNAIPTDSCSQAIASFHQEPNVAYHRKSEVWENDKFYSRYFNEETNASHVLMAFSLLRGIELHKRSLMQKDQRTDIESEQLEFLRNRGATFLLTAAIANCIEVFLGHAVPNKFRIGFGNASLPTAIQYWEPIIHATIPFAPQLAEATGPGLKTKPKIDQAIRTFRQLVDATKAANATVYSTFAGIVVVRD